MSGGRANVLKRGLDYYTENPWNVEWGGKATTMRIGWTTRELGDKSLVPAALAAFAPRLAALGLCLAA